MMSLLASAGVSIASGTEAPAVEPAAAVEPEAGLEAEAAFGCFLNSSNIWKKSFALVRKYLGMFVSLFLEMCLQINATKESRCAKVPASGPDNRDVVYVAGSRMKRISIAAFSVRREYLVQRSGKQEPLKYFPL